MPGIARQFEPQITRTGGALSRYRFIARCSGCQKTDTYESSTAAGDDVVKGYFKDRGWLLARDRAHDLCSACLAKPHRAQPPLTFGSKRGAYWLVRSAIRQLHRHVAQGDSPCRT